MNRSTRLTLRSTAALAVVTVAIGVGAQPASAHVTVRADATPPVGTRA